MKATLLIGFLFILSFIGYSQTTIFHENFELPSGNDSMTSVGTPAWSINTSYYAQGTQSIKNVPSSSFSDTVSLVTNSFSTTGLSSVLLSFSHICKIDMLDKGEIQVSINGGLSWVSLTASHYLGTTTAFSTNKFSAMSYAFDWRADSNIIMPTNLWWKNESFDISSLVGNQTQVKVRFIITNAASLAPGDKGAYGWLIDDINIVAAPSELTPPSLTMITAPTGSIYGSTAIKVDAIITDASGIDTARLAYSITNGISDTLGMVRIVGDTFRAYIPFPGFGRSVCYKVIARDASGSHNMVYYPSSTGCTNFITTYSAGGTYIVGTGTTLSSTYSFPTAYENYWYQTWQQFLYTKAELNALGASGGNIVSLAMQISTLPDASYFAPDYNIKMGTTSNTNLSSFITTGLTNVYGPTQSSASIGWNTINFSTPFVWDGNSNIVVDLRQTGNYGNANASTYYTPTPNNTLFSAYSSSNNSAFWSSAPSGTASVNRPNMKFVIMGTSSLTTDIGVEQIVYPYGGVLANSNFNVDVKLKNFGTDTITSATINWKVDGVLKTPFSWTGTLYKDSLTAVITLGVLNIPAGNHSIEVWSTNPNGVVDLNWGNDSKSINFFACANQLSGSYTIGGTTPDFASFADALTGLTQCGIVGPVVLNVAPGTYTGQITIPPISGSSSTNTVTFQSSNGDSTSVNLEFDASGTADNWVVKFNGASYVNFKGMTMKAIDSTYATLVEFTGNSHNIKLSNNVFIGTTNYLTNNNQALVKSLATSKDSSLTIQNNRFMYGYNGLVLFGPQSSELDKSISVKNNIFRNQIKYNAYFENIDALDFGNNVVKNDSSLNNSEGIYLKHIKNQWKFYNNNINLNLGLRAISIWNCNSSYNAEAMIYNNMISMSGVVTHLVDFANGTNIKFYYNSFNRNSSTAGNAVFINETGGTTDSLYFLNNIFVNNCNQGYAINFNFAKGTKKLIFDNNNYYSLSSNLGKLGSDASSLSAWKILTSQDQNSLSINPYFNSIFNLHVLNNMLNGAAQVISGITADIDGNIRNTTTPDIGADEFDPSPYDLAAIEVVGPSTICGLGTTETIKVKIKNVGSAIVNGGFTASYQITGLTTVVTENASTVINPGDTGTFTFNTKANLDIFSLGKDSIFKFTAWVNLASDPIKNNDTTIGFITSGYKPLPPVANDTTINYGTFALLSPQTSNNVLWYNSQNSTQSIYVGIPYNTGNLYDTTKYYVETKAFSQVNATLGTGTSTTSAMCLTPFSSYYEGARSQYLILASELNALGITAGNINSLAFDVTTPGAYVMNDVSIKIAPTTTNALTGYVTGNFSTVYTNALLAIPSAGWNNFTFSTPFVWDGTSNIVIDFCHDNDISSTCASCYGTSSTINYTATSFNSVYGTYADNVQSCGVSAPIVVAPNTSRPNMKFNATSMGMCSSDRVPLTVKITGYPQNDAGLISVVAPTGSVPSGTSQIVKLKLKNFGIQPLTSVTINRIINNVARPAYTWTGNLAYKDSLIINTDTLTFGGGLYTLKAYTTMPNNVADTINTNDSISSSFLSCLNGTYTIGDTTGGIQKDFPNFIAAKNALTIAGVCGPVVFNVDSGLYLGRVEFVNIPGSSLTNTITFQSAMGDSTKVILQDSNTSLANYVLKLNGASYITFKGITIKSTGASYGYVVNILNSSKNVTIQNCRLLTNASTSSYFAGIYSTTNNHDLSIINNYIENGYYGLYIYGVSSVSFMKNTKIINNTIKGFYYSGSYLYYQDSITFSQNTMYSSTSFTYGYGVYTYYANNLRMLKNRIYMRPTVGGSVYGALYIYSSSGTATNRGLIANNFVSIYGPNTTGSHYGIYNYYSNYNDILFNSINISAGGATSAALSVSYGGNNNVLNNNLRNTASGFAYYVPSAAGVNLSNNNNFYSNGTNLAYWLSNNTDLAALISASTKDSASVNLNIQYIDSNNLHIQSTALSIKGVADSRVLDDIDGEVRFSLPTIGADEVLLIPIDGGVESILLTPTTITEFDTVIVKLIIRNFGTSTLTNFPVSYKVNGGAPITATFTNNLISVQSDTIVMPYFIAGAGNNSICAYTAITGDTNLFNDQTCKNFFSQPVFDAKLMKTEKLAEGCGLGSDTLKIWIKNTGSKTINGNINAKYRVLNGANIVTQAVTDSIIVGDSLMFKFTTPINLSVTTTDSIFKIKTWVELTADHEKTNDSALVITKSLHVPPTPITSNVSVPYASPATVYATSSTSDSILWYDEMVGGNKLIEGNSYTTGLLYTTDTLYAEARAGLPAATVYTGTGTTVNANTSYPTPYGNFWWGSKEQYLLTKAELNALGVQGGPITSLAFDVDAVNSCPALINYYISLGHTSTSSMASFITTGLTTVYTNPSFQPVTGWNTHTFTTPFIWNGNDNIIVEVCFNNSSYVTSGNAGVKATATSFPSVASVHGDNATNCTAPGSPTFYSVRPNMKLIVSASGCSSTRSMSIITVAAPTANDAGILSIEEPISSVYLGGQESIKVKIRNFGTSPMSNFSVSYKIDNNTIVTENVAATIAPQSTLIYTFATKGSLSIQGTTYSIKAWTSLIPDNNHLNDSVVKNVTNLLPNYCTSAANYSTYYDIENVTFAGINNTSPSPYSALYTNYTNLSPGIISGGSIYPISIKTNYNSSTTTAGYLKVFIDYNRDGIYTQPDEVAFESTFSGIATLTGTVTVPQNAINGQTQMRIVARYNATAANVTPCGLYDYGETEDYLMLISPKIPHDASVEVIQQPTSLVSANTPVDVKARIKNIGSDTIFINNLTVNYSINGTLGTGQTNAYYIAPGDTTIFTFSNVTFPVGYNTLCVQTTLAGDSNMFNNELCKTVFGQFVTNLPYCDAFDASSDYWYHADTVWQRGIPAGTTINTSHSTPNVYKTSLSGLYPNNANVSLMSPQFNFTVLNPLDTATLSVWYTINAQSGSDYGLIEYSTNGGSSWSNLSWIGDPASTNGYNLGISGTHCWSGVIPWTKFTMKLDPAIYNAATNMQFRFRFFSNASTNNNDGFAIDDFCIDVPQQQIDAELDSIILPFGSVPYGTNQPVTVKIINNGVSALTSIPMHYRINNTGAPIQDVWVGNLPSGASVNHTFATNFNVPTTGNSFTITAAVNAAGDGFHGNDSITNTIIINPPAKDAGVTQIIEPVGGNDTTCFEKAYQIKVTVKNFGSDPITSMNIQYSVNGVVKKTEPWTGNLAPGASVNYTFTDSMVALTGFYAICVKTILPNDAIATNDQVCKNLIGKVCIGMEEKWDAGFTLEQNVPNPSKTLTKIGFETPVFGTVKFNLTNVLGQTVQTQTYEFNAGRHAIDLNTSKLAEGVYYYSIELEGHRLVKKMIVVK